MSKELNELEKSVWVEKWRPRTFEDLIFDKKDYILKLLKNPKEIPSLILYSNSPGTGKTSLAKLIVSNLGCDCLVLNASLDRNIETVREEVSHFSRCISSVQGIKRCVFMDEADGLTRQAQDSLRNLMEDYHENVFFIFSANNKNKIIDAIQSRCQLINFESPSKASIIVRLIDICDAEKLDIQPELLEKLIDKLFPDMRKMLSALQMYSIKGTLEVEDDIANYEKFLSYLKNKDVKAICDTTYSGDFSILGWQTWYFNKLYQNYNTADFEKTRQIASRLANIEKFSNLQVNLELIFISEVLEISKLI